MNVSKQNVFTENNQLQPVFDNTIQEYIDTFVIDVNNKSYWDKVTGGTSNDVLDNCDNLSKCLIDDEGNLKKRKDDSGMSHSESKEERFISIKKALETPRTYSKDGKFYTSKFDNALFYLPVAINRKEKIRRNDYSKILLGSSCRSKLQRNSNKEKFNRTKISEKDLDKPITINGCKYIPYLYLGTFKDRKGIDDDVDFIMANMTTDIVNLNQKADSELYGSTPTKTSKSDKDKTSTDKDKVDPCLSFHDIMSKWHEETIDPNFKGPVVGCCDYLSTDSDMQENLRKGTNSKFLITSNKTCIVPLTVDEEKYKQMKTLFQQSVSLIIYLVDCNDTDECSDKDKDESKVQSGGPVSKASTRDIGYLTSDLL